MANQTVDHERPQVAKSIASGKYCFLVYDEANPHVPMMGVCEHITIRQALSDRRWWLSYLSGYTEGP